MPRTKQSTEFAVTGIWLVLAMLSTGSAAANDYAQSAAPRPLPPHTARPIESNRQSWPQGQQPIANEPPRRLPERFASAEVAAPGTGAPGTGAPGTGAPGTGAPGTGAPGMGANEGPRPLTAPAGRPLTGERNLGGLAKNLEGKLPPGLSGAASIGIVVGLFLLVIWTARRSANSNLGRLPREAVEVLGRAPLAGRQQVHLVRCGHKLLLVSITPTATETLTEIVDPAEVERLEQLCRQPGQSGNPVRDLFARFAGGSRRTDYFQPQAPDELDFDHLGSVQQRRQESRT